VKTRAHWKLQCSKRKGGKNWLVCELKYDYKHLRQWQNGKENSLKSVKSRLQMCSINIKTIVYREQQLTTLMEACGSVDDSSQQTQQCDKDAPL